MSIINWAPQANNDSCLNSLNLRRQTSEVFWRLDFQHPRCRTPVSRTPLGDMVSIHERIVINIWGAEVMETEAIHLPFCKCIKHFQQAAQIYT